MGLLSKIFSKKYKSTNEIEMMMDQNTPEADPRRFFEHLISRNLYVLILNQGEPKGHFVSKAGDTIKFIISDQKAGPPVAFAFTSLEALTYVAKQREGGLNYLRLEARTLFKMLIDAELGLHLNPGIGNSLVLFIENLKFVLSELEKGPRASV